MQTAALITWRPKEGHNTSVVHSLDDWPREKPKQVSLEADIYGIAHRLHVGITTWTCQLLTREGGNQGKASMWPMGCQYYYTCTWPQEQPAPYGPCQASELYH